jgi:hypothetical protein
MSTTAKNFMIDAARFLGSPLFPGESRIRKLWGNPARRPQFPVVFFYAPLVGGEGGIKMPRYRKAASCRVIQPIDDYSGPLTQVAAVAEDVGVDALIRAIDEGVPVYSAGSTLLTDYSAVSILAETHTLAGEAS